MRLYPLQDKGYRRFLRPKVDGSTHGHPVILVLETGAGDAEVTRTWEGPESTRRGRLKGM